SCGPSHRSAPEPRLLQEAGPAGPAARSNVTNNSGRARTMPDPAISCRQGARHPTGLLQLDLGASRFELFLQLFGFGLAGLLLDGLATGFDQVFGFFQAQTGD